MEVSGPQASQIMGIHAAPDLIESFPSSVQPKFDTMLKDMLISLRSSLHNDIVATMRERVDYVENAMGEYSISFNTLVDSHNAHSNDHMWLKDKIADLEARSRQNNLKIRGITETVLASQLLQYVHELFSDLVPSLSTLELTVDRVHRVPKSSFLAEEVPRDVLIRLHFYRTKELLLDAFRKSTQCPEQYASLQSIQTHTAA